MKIKVNGKLMHVFDVIDGERASRAQISHGFIQINVGVSSPSRAITLPGHLWPLKQGLTISGTKVEPAT